MRKPVLCGSLEIGSWLQACVRLHVGSVGNFLQKTPGEGRAPNSVRRKNLALSLHVGRTFVREKVTAHYPVLARPGGGDERMVPERS
jgi:hypothetical protein